MSDQPILSPAAQELEQVKLAVAVRILGYTDRHVRRLIERGELPAIGRGRMLRIRLCDIRAWQAQHQRGGRHAQE